jgi:DNA-binding NtrC family response regulator
MASSFHQATAATPLIKLLLVEDEAISRLALTRLLIDEGYSVVSTATGEEALELLGTQSFDAVITDVKLRGEVNGFDVLREFEWINPGKPKLLITGYFPGHLTEQAVEAIYISKPVDLDDFLLILKRALPVSSGQITPKHDNFRKVRPLH